jgi:hypothetical protein
VVETCRGNKDKNRNKIALTVEYALFIVILILTFFPYFEKMKVGLCDLHAVCVSVNPASVNFECLNQFLWNFVCILYHLSPSQILSISLYVCMYIPPTVATQKLSKHLRAATNTRNGGRTVGRVCLYISLSFLGNNSVKTFPRQLIIG